MDKYRKVYVVDDDRAARTSIAETLISSDFEVRPLGEVDFEELASSLSPGCAVVEIFHESVANFRSLEIAISQNSALPTVAMCADCSIQLAVTAIKLGAIDVYEKRTPVTQLITIVEQAVSALPSLLDQKSSRQLTIEAILSLTKRQFQILRLVSEGHLSKTVANILGLSTRTVEMHREDITHRLNCRRMVDAVIMLQSVSREKEIVARSERDLIGITTLH